jgi:hypothetical protein
MSRNDNEPWQPPQKFALPERRLTIEVRPLYAVTHITGPVHEVADVVEAAKVVRALELSAHACENLDAPGRTPARA